MADPTAPAAPAAPVAAPVAPVVAAPAVELLSAAPPAPVTAPRGAASPDPAPTPIAEPAPENVVPPAPPAGEGDAPPAPSPAEPPAVPEAAEPTTGSAVVAYDLKMPEGLKANDEIMSKATSLFRDNAIPPETAQKLLDFHADEIKRLTDTTRQNQDDVWAQTRQRWVAEGKKMFGNHYDSTVNDARSAITNLFQDKKERAEVWAALTATGAGDHPLIIRAFARAQRKMSERAAPTQTPSSGASVSAPWDKRYGGLR